jgi:hypothetical protein
MPPPPVESVTVFTVMQHAGHRGDLLHPQPEACQLKEFKLVVMRDSCSRD